jgi:molecular chaperone GrpE (heat shock protein)
MKRLIILAAALALAPMAGAQLYKYVDKDGKTVYSDQPPAGIDSKQINSAGRSTAPADTPKTAVQRDKDLDKGRKEGAEKAKKSTEDADRSAQNEARCRDLKANYQMFVDGGRIQKNNEKGERELMSDAEIESARERTRREMEEACKK